MARGYSTPLQINSDTTPFNQMAFVIQQMLNKTATATLVQVKKVTNSGGVSPVGTVDVQPMVNQVDGEFNATPHGKIFALPYFRLQGGAGAVILDPVVGDIGLAIFCHTDISVVKATKKPGNPGSRRRYDWADGLYVGGFLGATPTVYIRFDSSGGITLHPTGGQKVTLDGDVQVNGTLTATTDVVANGTSLHTHTHKGVTTGSGNTGTPN